MVIDRGVLLYEKSIIYYVNCERECEKDRNCKICFLFF